MHMINEEMFLDTWEKFMQSNKEIEMNGWNTQLLILTPMREAKVYPIKKIKMYKNTGRGSDDFGGVRAAGFNQAAHKYNHKVKLGCLMVDYELLEKEIARAYFVVALLVGISACRKTNLYKQIQTGKKSII